MLETLIMKLYLKYLLICENIVCRTIIIFYTFFLKYLKSVFYIKIQLLKCTSLIVSCRVPQYTPYV